MRSTMYLLLIYIFLCVPLSVLVQITEQTVQISQNNKTVTTVVNSTQISTHNSSNNNLTEKYQNVTVSDSGPATSQSQIDSPLMTTDANQSSPTIISEDDWKTTETQTVSDDPETNNSGVDRESAGTTATLQSSQISQSQGTIFTTALLPHGDTGETGGGGGGGGQAAPTADSQLGDATVTTLGANQTYDIVSDTNPNLLITTTAGSTRASSSNTTTDTGNSTFSTNLMHFTSESDNPFVPIKSATSNRAAGTLMVSSSTSSYSNDSFVDVTEKTPETTDKEMSPVTMMNISHSRNVSSVTLSDLLNSSNSDFSMSTYPSILSTLSPSLETASTSPPNVIFDNFTDITSENVLLCFQEEHTLRFNSMAGQIVFSEDSYNSTTAEYCYIEFRSPPETLLQMFVSINTNSCLDYSLYLKSKSPLYFYRYFRCSSQAALVTNYGNSVTVRLKRRGVNASLDLFFNFTAVPLPQLQVLFNTPTTGYIQTPEWDGQMRYPPHLDTWTRLDVPTNFSVMISFLFFDIEGHTDCNYDRLTVQVKVNKTSNESLELIHCNNKPVLKPTVFHSNVLLFHFKSDESVEHLGFRLQFSFHDLSETPQKDDDGKWNCSVPYWPQFQQHLNCNVVEECVSGKDEEQCDHTSEKCGKGLLLIASKCYIFISEEKPVTWNEAANECLRREAYLASLNSPREWKEVIAIVSSFIKETVYFGLQTSGPSFPELYQDQFQWADGSAVFYAKVYRPYYSSSTDCSALRQFAYKDPNTLTMVECHSNMTTSFLCETDIIQGTDPQEQSGQIVFKPSERQNDIIGDKYVTCPAGHLTHKFFACDLQSSCWASHQGDLVSSVTCGYKGEPRPPSLRCRNGVDYVPYSLVCDHRPDCSDNSDEDFCVFSPCRPLGKFQCNNGQCVEHKQHCDKIPHCLDGSDERQCPWYSRGSLYTPEPPAIVMFDGFGSYKVQSLELYNNKTNSSDLGACPETHFLCPGNLTYCMPVFVRCNGVYDCPGREDEDGCDRFHCPGFYRCRASSICVHTRHLCDGAFQCPKRDDELLCDAPCPQNCSCQGLAFYCHGQFAAEQYPELRFLHAVESGLTPQNLKTNTMLLYLNLAKSKLKHFDKVQFPNLRILDLSDNELSSLRTTQLVNMMNLQKISLAGNPLKYVLGERHDSSWQFPLLQTIDLSNVILSELNVTALSIFPNLAVLNFRDCRIKSIAGEGFQSLPFLRYIDMKGCPMTKFPTTIFKGLRRLKEVWADNYKLCCSAALPTNFLVANCHSPSDEISSCDALLRSDFYRVILSLFAALALIGNLGSFVYRVLINRQVSDLGFGVFVTHLCVSDFLMGVYLAVIGIADRMYQGNYLWKDDVWKHSAGCKVAGFLSLLSSEVSAFIICLITFDRFLVLRFPFSNLYFKKKSAHVACMIVWTIGVVFAGIPLLPVTAHWQFYSQNGICIPLPITRNDFAGHDYSFGVIIIVNFILFLLIAAGQVFIYWSIRTNSMAAGDSNKKSNDLTIARRLITIAMSDFLCWFPIGLLGLLASIGVPVPGEVSVAIAIIILPVNSAINPFLYTLNMLMERRRRAREKRIQKMIMSTFASKYSETAVDHLGDGYTKAEALELLRSWLSQSLLSAENLEKVVLETRNEQKSVETPNK